jgi:hypothetical protein
MSTSYFDSTPHLPFNSTASDEQHFINIGSPESLLLTTPCNREVDSSKEVIVP